jgi:hypothetical protein
VVAGVLQSFEGQGTAYLAQMAPVNAAVPKATRRPVSITVLAWLLLVGCLFIPLSLVLHAPAILFTKLLTGWPSVLFFAVFAALQLGIGIGLLRLRPAARIAAIGYFSFGFLNSAVFYLAPGGHARALSLIDSQQSMFPWMRSLPDQARFHFDPAPFLILGGVSGLAMLAVPLYFLITRKSVFETAAAGLESGRTQP